jgi:hypothetical protein
MREDPSKYAAQPSPQAFLAVVIFNFIVLGKMIDRSLRV